MSKKIMYKNYTTIMEYDEENEIFFGKIEGEEHDIAFHAQNPAKFIKEFEKAVENLIEIEKWRNPKITEEKMFELLHGKNHDA